MRELRAYFEDYADLPGWFLPEAAATSACLLELQRSRRVAGDILEIGVHSGRSACLFAMFAEASEKMVLCDFAMRQIALDAVGQVKTENLVPIKVDSEVLHQRKELQNAAKSFRWIHIDGDHTARMVVRDLTLADTLLAADGVIMLDDFFQPQYPQVAQAVFHYLWMNPFSLTMFLNGHNKAYLCRPRASKMYLEYIRDVYYAQMVDLGFPKIRVAKTSPVDELNCFGVLNVSDGSQGYRGFDWDQKQVDI